MALNLVLVTITISLYGILALHKNESGNNPISLDSTLEDNLSVSPAHSTHRLKSSVLDMTSSSTSNPIISPIMTTTDDVPFLPTGIVSPYRSAQSSQDQMDNQNGSVEKKNFTPSYFIGEVIPEPYVPERFQISRSSHSRNNSHRSYQNPVSSQTVLAFQKLLPMMEQIRQAALPPIEDPPEPLGYHTYHHHITPVHEPSMEEEDSTTAKYAVNYGDDQHSDRPLYTPYKFEGGHYNMLPPKLPVAFEDPQIGQVATHQKPLKHEHSHHEDGTGNYQGYIDDYFSGDHHKNHGDPGKDLKDYASGLGFPKFHEDYMNAHTHHHIQDSEFVPPPPYYPHEPDIPYGHLKEVHYKVIKQKPWGLLPLAAALVPLGLLAAALNPSVLHINSSQPMPPKHRSLEDPLDTLENLEGLHLDVDCQRRAFCEAAAQGAKPQATSAHRSLWKLANSIPVDQAKSLGLGEVLKAVKSGSCSTLKCVPPKKQSVTNSAPTT